MPAIAIIGAGPLGRGLARRAAEAGYAVTLEDVMPANLRSAAEQLRERLSPDALPAVRFAATVEDAVREADAVIDCVPDELESKLEIFCMIDRMAPPRTILMSPMQATSVADLAACTYRAERCVGVAVDARTLEADGRLPLPIRVLPETADDVLDFVTDFWTRAGWLPVVSLDRGGN